MKCTITRRKITWIYAEAIRIGDHIWWRSDTGRFERRFSEW
jgi:CDP-paratose 2-epimerase